MSPTIGMSHSSNLADILTMQYFISMYQCGLDQKNREHFSTQTLKLICTDSNHQVYKNGPQKHTLNLTSCFPLPDIFKRAVKNIFSLHLHSFYLSYVTYRDVMKNHHLFICKLKKHALAMYSKGSRCHLQLKLCISILLRNN